MSQPYESPMATMERRAIAETLVAMQPEESSFIAAELVWGRGLRDADGRVLRKFIGIIYSPAEDLYFHYWWGKYIDWAYARGHLTVTPTI